MFVHHYKKLPVLRTVKTEWLVWCSVLLVSALMMGYLIWSERALVIAADIERMRLQTLVIDENLGRQLEGVRSVLDSTRDALRANGLCAADCRRLLLQSLKRALMAR